MNKLLILALLLVFICCDTPTTPPKPVADVQIAAQGDLTFYYAPLTNEWVACFDVIVTESRGVGGRVAMCYLGFVKNGVDTGSDVFQGGVFSPCGALKIPCPASAGGSIFDLMNITITGMDDNGTSFSVGIEYKYVLINGNLEVR